MNDNRKNESILIVDDTPENLNVLSDMLTAENYETRPVPSGALAVMAAKNNPPDLILLDICMPEMDGYEVCRVFKSDEKLKEIPVIFISALSESFDKVKAFSVGGVDYITKPFQFEEVNARIKTHLELMHSRRELKSLLSNTLIGAVKILTEILAISSPHAFNQSVRRRNYVQSMLHILGISETWSIEIAAMLSTVGCISIPPDIWEKKSRPGLLTEKELKILDSYPAAGSQFISKIPRLESVSEIIRTQLSPPEVSDDELLLRNYTLLGAHILKIINDYDEFVIPGVTAEEAISKIENSAFQYPRILLDALRKMLNLDSSSAVVKEIDIYEIREGMILEEDIMLDENRKLISAKTEISSGLLDIIRNFSKNYSIKKNIKVSTR